MAIQKHKRIFYPAGFISLLVLPWLCLWYLKEGKMLAFRAPGSMEIVISDLKSEYERSTFHAYRKTIKNFTDIVITGNKIDNKIKLEFLRIKTEELVRSQNVIDGIRVIFKPDAKYNSLVKAYDISKSENLKLFMIKGEDTLFIFPDSRIVLDILMKRDSLMKIGDFYWPICGTSFYENEMQWKLQKQKEEKLLKKIDFKRKIEIQNKIKKILLPSSLIFISIIFLSFRQLYFLRKH